MKMKYMTEEHGITIAKIRAKWAGTVYDCE
jgi:hypothetical protein